MFPVTVAAEVPLPALTAGFQAFELAKTGYTTSEYTEAYAGTAKKR